MQSDNIIKQALSIQNQNNLFLKKALKYTGCTPGDEVNLIFHWFAKNSDPETEQIKKQLSFPTNLTFFKNKWWPEKFIRDTCYKTANPRFFKTLLEDDKIDPSDNDSYLLFLGSNDICPDKKYDPYIDGKIWNALDLNMTKIIRALFVIIFKYKMSGDKTDSNYYERLFKINIINKPLSKPSSSKLDLKFWREIPPKLRDKTNVKAPNDIPHSYTFIKNEFEKFIIETYFQRTELESEYSYALNVLMSRFKKGKFNFDDFWNLLAIKYKNNNEVKDILKSKIDIKCPKTSSGNNLFIKNANDFSINNIIEFTNNNSIDYKNINQSIKYNLNLPSRKLFAQKIFTDPYLAACELNLSAGVVTRAILGQYYSRIWGANPIYDDKYTAWTFLFQYIKSNGPYNFTGCPSSTSSSSSSSSSTSGSSTVPVIWTTSTSGGSSTSSGSSSSSTAPPPPPPKPNPPTPKPIPGAKPKVCKATFYDLGFIDYCSEVIQPEELAILVEKLINTIKNLEFAKLARQAGMANIYTGAVKSTDELVDMGIDLASSLLGR